jgi:hypothetical protein
MPKNIPFHKLRLASTVLFNGFVIKTYFYNGDVYQRYANKIGKWWVKTPFRKNAAIPDDVHL